MRTLSNICKCRLLGMRVENKRLMLAWHVYLMTIAIRVQRVLE